MGHLKVDRVTKRYGARTVLDDVSFDVRPGELVLLSGRSGSGKSTLMAIAAGLKAPTAGRVLVNEDDVAAMDEEARTAFRLRRLGMVFQDFQLIPDLTVEENVRLPMKLARRKDARVRSLKLLAQLGMDEHASAFPETLSGGEQQRVAIARALANDPEVILADEPSANLDEENAHTVLGLLRSIAGQSRTVLVASHDPIAETYADRRVAIKDGRVKVQRRAAAPGENVISAPLKKGPTGAQNA